MTTGKKKSKSFHEVACDRHGIAHRTDNHRSVKVGYRKGRAIGGCPHCKREQAAALKA